MAGLVQLINQYMLTEFVPFMCKEHHLKEKDVAATWMRFASVQCNTSDQEESIVETRDASHQISMSEGEEEVVVEEKKKKKVLKKKKEKKVLPKEGENDDVNDADDEEEANEKMTLAHLKEICKRKNLKVTGTKKQLLTRIQENNAVSAPPPPPDTPPLFDAETDEEDLVTITPVRPIKKAQRKRLLPNVLEEMEKKKPEVIIVTDKYGNIIHEETGIAFSHDEEEIDGVKCRYAIGYRLESGHLEELNTEKMELCHQYGFRYRVPENFDYDENNFSLVA